MKKGELVGILNGKWTSGTPWPSLRVGRVWRPDLKEVWASGVVEFRERKRLIGWLLISSSCAQGRSALTSLLGDQIYAVYVYSTFLVACILLYSSRGRKLVYVGEPGLVSEGFGQLADRLENKSLLPTHNNCTKQRSFILSFHPQRCGGTQHLDLSFQKLLRQDLGRWVKNKKSFNAFINPIIAKLLPMVHFSLDVLPSWADRGSCAHKSVC